jgi:hypothetical protein
MKALAIAAVLFFAVSPAYAQPSFDDGKKKDADKKLEAVRQAEQDKAYKSSLQRIQPKDAPSSDPWGSVRSDGTTPSQGKSKTPANTAR